MPTYEFACADCKKKFSLTLSFSEYDKKKPKCPKCSSGKVKRVLGSVFAKTSKKS
ncbi:MAG: zinc ribbon domain-containing protein [Planctomycetes bacterium]|nr:zinc ribbon domain-containing protein [Planctomycetota bacterium]